MASAFSHRDHSWVLQKSKASVLAQATEIEAEGVELGWRPLVSSQAPWQPEVPDGTCGLCLLYLDITRSSLCHLLFWCHHSCLLSSQNGVNSEWEADILHFSYICQNLCSSHLCCVRCWTQLCLGTGHWTSEPEYVPRGVCSAAAWD